MATENRASSSASSDVDAYVNNSSTLASRVKLRRLTGTAAKTQQTAELTKRSTLSEYSSEYFVSNSRIVVEKSVCKQKRFCKSVMDASEKSSIRGNDGSPVVDSAKSAGHLRGKQQSTKTAKEMVSREAHEKKDKSEFVSTKDANISVFRQQQQSYSESSTCYAGVPDDNNNTSSSDVDWEDVEGK